MLFISMDLVTPLHPSNKDHQYALTVICMLTGYTFCIHIKTKTATKVVHAYVDKMCATFGSNL